jgi:hypothetical protein
MTSEYVSSPSSGAKKGSRCGASSKYRQSLPGSGSSEEICYGWIKVAAKVIPGIGRDRRPVSVLH